MRINAKWTQDLSVSIKNKTRALPKRNSFIICSEESLTMTQRLKVIKRKNKFKCIFKKFCKTLLLLSHFSHVRLCVTPQTAAHQAPPSLGFSRQEYWSGLPFPPPGDLPDPSIEPVSHVSCIGRWILYHQRCLGSPR